MNIHCGVIRSCTWKWQHVRPRGSQPFPISTPLRCVTACLVCLGAPYSSVSGEGVVSRGYVVCKSTFPCILESVLKLPPFSCIAPSTLTVISRTRIFNFYLRGLLFSALSPIGKPELPPGEVTWCQKLFLGEGTWGSTLNLTPILTYYFCLHN